MISSMCRLPGLGHEDATSKKGESNGKGHMYNQMKTGFL